MIRNYLGFPRGVSGGELAFRAWEQALLFGAQFVFMQRATGLTDRAATSRVVALSDGSEAVARAVIIAAGVTYRRLGIPALDRLVGVGVFYGAAGVEAPAMAGEEVYVVGGANSAGQAALHLARFAARVTLLVRGESLAAGMSDYLITQIEATPNVEVRLRTRVVDGRGEARLEALTLEDAGTGQREEVAAAAVFVLIGAEPRTDWLRDAVQRDDRGIPPDRSRRSRAGVAVGACRRCRSRPACRACSPSATCGTARSSASPAPSARARWRLAPSISTWPSYPAAAQLPDSRAARRDRRRYSRRRPTPGTAVRRYRA